MREARLRYFGHVIKRGSNDLMNMCEKSDIVGAKKGKDRAKKYRGGVIRQT